MLSPNTKLQNRYRIIRQLGKGGMGTVYEAIDERVSCVVAVKETLVATDAGARRAFEREAALLANLRHAALPKVMDHFTEDGGQFLVMEFVPGYDLAELMEIRGTAFSPAQVLQWADELLRVLEYLHGHQPPILHRDIKPANLKHTRQGEIFLLDFGLAKGSTGQMQTLQTSHSVRGFTPVYASLEQIYGKGTDPRSDLYSLGATLYHLMTGMPPIDAPTRFNAFEDDQQDPLLPIEEINTHVSAAIAAVIHRAMALSRKARYPNATEMRHALRQADEESRRAEAARLHAEAEAARQAAEAEAARRRIAEEEERRRQEEAETLRLQEEQRLLRVEEERNRREAEALEASRTVEQPNAARATAAGTEGAKDTGALPATRDVKTVETAQEQLYQSAGANNPLSAGAVTGKLSRKTVNRRLLIVTAVAFIAVAIIFGVWMIPRGSAPGESVRQQAAERQPSVVPQPDDKVSPPTPPAGMAYVSGGEFMMGRDNGDAYESPAHRVAVRPFFIDIYEVTNEEYAKFITAMNRDTPHVYPAGAQRRPVTGVTWDDAVAYAKWVGKRLPTEEEWEFAARGTDGRLYPWGNAWRAGLANAEGTSDGAVDVGHYQGQSPFGVFDMVGNVWEWTASKLTAYERGRALPNKPPGELRVIRGGSYIEDRNEATTTYRRGYPVSGVDYDKTGFRCAKDVTEPPGQN